MRRPGKTQALPPPAGNPPPHTGQGGAPTGTSLPYRARQAAESGPRQQIRQRKRQQQPTETTE